MALTKSSGCQSLAAPEYLKFQTSILVVLKGRASQFLCFGNSKSYCLRVKFVVETLSVCATAKKASELTVLTFGGQQYRLVERHPV